jgi:hypothetical protein
VSGYICDKCGGTVHIGDWPFCKGGPDDHRPGGGFGFDPFTPYLDPHIDPNGRDVKFVPSLGRKMQGTWITSREQRRAIMKANNLEWAGRPMGEGGNEV